jgi:hypothetical protein
MKKLLQHISGVIGVAVLLMAAGYAMAPHMLALFHTNRVIEHTNITRIQGIPFKPDTLSISQRIDSQLIYVAQPQFLDQPLCLRLWMGSSQLHSTLGVISVEVQSGDTTWQTQKVYRQHRSWLFCFDTLRIADLQSSRPSYFQITVLQPERYLILSGIHAGFSSQPLLQASVNGQAVEPSIQYIIEAQSPMQIKHVLQFAGLLLFLSLLGHFTLVAPWLPPSKWSSQ